MKSTAVLLGYALSFASIVSAQGFLVEDGPEGFDTLVYVFSGALEITGGAVYEDPASEPVATSGDVVRFDYGLKDGPGPWMERIHDVEYRSVTYQISDPARVSDPWILDPGETFLGASLTDGEAPHGWFETGTGSEGGLNFSVRYGASTFNFSDDHYVLDTDLESPGNELDPSSTSFYEALITGLLSGESVLIDVSPKPYASTFGLVAPYTFDFEALNLATELVIPEGSLSTIPEASAAPVICSLALVWTLARRRRRRV